MVSGRSEGMLLMDNAIANLYKDGLISGEVAFLNSEDRTPYQQYANAQGGAGPTSHARPKSQTQPRPMPQQTQPRPMPPQHSSQVPQGEPRSLNPLDRLRKLKKTGS